MSFNLYDDVEEKRPSYEQQFENFEEHNTQMFDLYNTINQSPQSQKWSINKIHTGLNKQIRKIKLVKKSKGSQYISDGQNFIIQRVASLDDAYHLTNQQNMNVLLQQKDLNKIIKKMKQLNLQ
ncbi:unnamed protein product [Paramecium primaurelia]|uniref:Uncharacterized protein n=1 Tax=Paramecium primaurelia TaxID=5886 RepID=A0A8S1PV54_PARPR|nr:unnamed protein product [Paramecium primaurelia]